MPTYEYECGSCGRRLSAFQRMSDPALSTCPECSGTLRRLVSGGAGILMKGPGRAESEPSCDRSSPCCGRAAPCDTRPCE